TSLIASSRSFNRGV
ncbi:hypothetical protein D047_4057B, partial [Vibrio parahaemolyticus VPTS-2010_2]